MIAVVGWVAWLVNGAVSALALVAGILLLMLLQHVRHLARLSKWLADPRPEALPDGSGIWEDVFAAFYHLLRRQRRSESRLTATLHDFRRAGMAMPDGLVILDGSNRIEWFPRRRSRLVGAHRPLRGKPQTDHQSRCY
jgi:two-component system phosphate regulon sensor histidine kinase PhoR